MRSTRGRSGGRASEGQAGDARALRERLDEGLVRLGGPAAALEDGVRERLVRFVRLLEKWNRVHNLTAVREARDMIGRHVLDSLALLPWLPPPTPARTTADGADASAGAVPDRLGAGTVAEPPGGVAAVDLLDIGSGAGLPVLPLALARPDLDGLSVDAVAKKIAFQRQAALELGIGNVAMRHARIEAVAASARVVLSRAFAAPEDFLALAAPRCAPDGVALVMLGRRERLPDALPAPFSLEGVHALDVPFDAGERHVAVCRAGDASRA